MNQKHFNTSIHITDQQIGVFFSHKNDSSLSKATEVILDDGTIDLGYIKNPVSLYKNIKKAFKKAKIKPANINWIIPDANILIREIQVLKMDVDQSNLDDYLNKEIGESIKHPFTKATFSYVIQEESEIDYRLIVYITDQNLIEDYLDIFEKCNIKEIHYGLISSSVNRLLSESNKIEDRALVVTLHDRMITINIIENQVTIFGMIDELPEQAISVENIEEYIERIANYYQYNLRKGKQAIQQVIILDFSDKNNYFTKMSKLKTGLTKKFSFMLIDYKIMNDLLRSHKSNVGIAYLSASMMHKDCPTPLNFQIERHKRGLIIANYLLVLTVAIIAFTSLIYIPLMNMKSEIHYQETINESLLIQESMLQNNIDYSNAFTSNEILYNEVFTYLESKDNSTFNYLSDLIDLLGDNVTLENCLINTQDKMIELDITGTTRNSLYEYVISLYETHGMLGDSSNQKWIASYPETTFTSPSTMRVVIYYA